MGQIRSTANVADNLAQCMRLIRQAANGGAKVSRTRQFQTSQKGYHGEGGCCATAGYSLVSHLEQVLFLPEAADYIASSPQESLALAQPQDESPFVRGLRDAAREARIDVSVGIHALVADTPPVPARASPAKDNITADGGRAGTRLYNRSLWIRSDGTVDDEATYDKLHLFDYGALRESALVRPGARLTPPFDTPVGRVGSLICFDLRFSEPALALAQPPGTIASPAPSLSSPVTATTSAPPGSNVRAAQILTYPSAFTVPTGEAHWEVLLRARAVETQSWVVAAAQVGWHNEKRASYGNSMVVGPWGEVALRLGGVGDKGSEGALGFVEMDLGAVERVRREMPLARRT